MITKENLREVLIYLGFTANNKDTIFKKTYQNDTNIFIEVDFNKGEITYPIIQESKTTSNFSQNEDFVVLECVDKLLSLGYKAQDLVLEKTWTLGHTGKSGRADITIFKEDEVYCIIECKTAGKKYENAKKDLFNNEEGKQLFSYAAQARSVEYLCLYASDFIQTNADNKKSSQIKVYESIVRFKDDKNILDLSQKDDSLLTFAGASEAKDFFRVWEETYNKQSYEGIIFNSKPYEIGIKPLLKKDLKSFDKNDGINVKFQEILRHNNISDKENAFNKLLSLFLCKCVDEQSKKEGEELDFQYKSFSDTYFSLYERIFKLFIKGMNEFLKEEVYKTKDNFIANTISTYIGKNRKKMQELLENELLKATLFSSNAFSFKETHNENLFKQNGKILVEVVELLSPYKISYSSKEQFLGELFETFLNEGFKEDEGRYFTPVPITRFIWNALPFEDFISFENTTFPKILDFACGSGHFLTEGVSAISDYCKALDIPINDEQISKNFYGIDKDNRLTRTTQVAMLLNGANAAKIRSIDGLEYNSEFYGDNQQIFDILVSNPPYSVKDFKAHLSKSILNGKEKFIPFEVLEYISFNSKVIENVFVERLTHILKPNALAAIILPSSILSNTDLATIKTREILLCNFALVSIVSFGNQTFGTTGTNTIVLFLKRFDEPPKKTELLEDSLEAILNGENLKDFEDKEILQQYLALQKIPEESYKSFLEQNKKCLENEYFKFYYKDFLDQTKTLQNKVAFKNLSAQEKEEILYKEFFAYAREKEKEKLKYFALTFKQTTLIVRSPSENAEQKKFLGYTISQAKNKSSGLVESGGLLSDKSNRNAEDKIAFAIKQSFKGEFYSNESFEKYLSFTHTCHLLNYEGSDFTKAINLNPAVVLNGHIEGNARSISNPFANCKYELVKLAECGEFIGGLWKGKKEPFIKAKVIRNTNFSMKGNLKLDSEYPELEVEAGQLEKRKLEYGDIIIEKSGGSNTQAVGRVVIFDFTTKDLYSFSNFTNRLRVTNEKINPFYLHLVLNYLYQQGVTFTMQSGTSGLKNLDMNAYKRLKIPLPPLEIQKQIVAECEKVEEQYNTIRMSIEEYQKLIKAILVKCGICEADTAQSTNSAGGGYNASFSSLDSIDTFIAQILAHIVELESKLDFEFLQSLTCHTKPLGEVSYQLKARSANLESVVGGLGDYKGDKGSDFAIQAPLSPLEKNKKGNLLDFSMIEYLTTLLESLPTPPKEGWDKISLNDKTYLSLNPSKKEIANIDENVLVSFVEMAAVSDNGFIQNKVDKSLKELKNGGYTYFKENDILIAKITPCMENGKCAIAKNLTNGLGLGSTEFHIFRAKEGLNNKFLFLCLNQDTIRTEAAKNMTGASGHRRVPIGFYESLQIPLPPLKSQQQIVNVIENIESHIAHLDSISPLLDSKKQEILKKFLMQ